MPPRNHDPSRNTATLLAVLALILAALGLMFLVAMVMPQVLGLVVVAGGFVFFCAFHYVVWGWWLGSVLQPEDDDEWTD